ncbi:MAG: Fur family transcriptional regulator [Pelistega sp.]|nr:Fur family transcriptional regulator [Pelistega sp.]
MSSPTHHSHDSHAHEHTPSPSEVKQGLADAVALCESRGTRLTPIRAQVLELMLKSGRSLKAYELLEQMQVVHPNSKPATIYRALDFLAEQGLIHRLDAINGWTACQHIHSHHHDLLIVCTVCGMFKELSAPHISQELRELLATVGFSPNAPETEIRATCDTCRQQSSDK